MITKSTRPPTTMMAIVVMDELPPSAFELLPVSSPADVIKGSDGSLVLVVDGTAVSDGAADSSVGLSSLISAGTASSVAASSVGVAVAVAVPVGVEVLSGSGVSEGVAVVPGVGVLVTDPAVGLAAD